MAIFSLVDCTIWAHDQDLTGNSNKLSLKTSVDDLDVTVFGSGGYHQRIGGLKMVEASAEGYCDTTAVPDAAAFAALGIADRAVTIAPASPATSTAFLFQAGEFSYEPFGAVGDVCPFSLGMKGTHKVGVARGQVAKAKGAVSAPGVLGSVLNLGAGGVGKFLYATLHVFSAGTTITVQVQSDDNAPFASPVTRATIGPITVVGGTFLVPVDTSGFGGTDNFWRFNISTITGTFTLAGAIAVQ